MLSDIKEDNRDKEQQSEDTAKEMLSQINQLEKNLEQQKTLKNERRERFLEELKNCDNVDQVLAKVEELDNVITELEEEKGNLQLRLVDFEEMTGNFSKKDPLFPRKINNI